MTTSYEGERELTRRLREAGPRRSVSEERIAAAMAAARPAWKAKIAERQQEHYTAWRRPLLAAAMAALALTAGWMSQRVFSPAAPVAWVERASGGNLVDGKPVAVGDVVRAGSRIEVEGLMAMRLASGGSLRLAEGTRAGLSDNREITLESGALYFDSGDASNSPNRSALTVATAWGSARDIGTQFELRLLPEHLLLRVREGEVEVTRQDERHLATAGQELRLDPEGKVIRGQLPPDDSAYAWVLEAAPPFLFEGKGLVEFFHWSARELGLELTWNSADLESQVEAISFHGSVSDLSPQAALEVVAAATDLEVEIQGRELRIRRADPAS